MLILFIYCSLLTVASLSFVPYYKQIVIIKDNTTFKSTNNNITSEVSKTCPPQ